MATVKLNSRSPYFIVASGEEGCADAPNQYIEISGPSIGTVNTDITLSVVPANFEPVSYLWTGGAIAGNTLKEITFTETSSGSVDYGVTATSQCGTQYTATITVSWNTVAQYVATLTVDNQIVGPSAAYTIGGNLDGAKVSGVSGDPYSFTTTLTLNDGYTADVALAISPTQPNAGTFASSDVSVTTTLTGTVSSAARYYLYRFPSSVLEGDTFDILLRTKDVADGTAVPFTITGVSADDLRRDSLTGSFVIQNGESRKTFEVLRDNIEEGDETFTLTLNDVVQDGNPVAINVTIQDSNTSQAQTVKVSESTFDSANNACASAVTTTEDAHYGLLSGQTFGEGIVLFKDMNLTERYPSAGKYYKILFNSKEYSATIGVSNQGQITNFVECGDEGEGEEIKDTTPTFTCTTADIEIYSGVVGQPLNFNIQNGTVATADIDKPNYVLGTTDYTFQVLIPSGFKNPGSKISCTVSGTGIAALPTWNCTNTNLDVKDGATGDSISYSYSDEIKASDFISIKNSSGGTVYLAGSNTYTFTHKIPTGYQGAGTSLACTDTATATTTPAFTCDIAQFKVENGIEGNSTLAGSAVQAGTLTAVSPSTYTVGTGVTYTATITIPSGYSNYPGTLTTCTDTADGSEKVYPVSNSLSISTVGVDNPGPKGDTVCNLEADKIVYYTGTVNNTTQFFTNRELTSPFTSAEKWHKLKILNPDGELIDWYGQIYSYPAGQLNNLTQCGFDVGDQGVEIGGEVTPTVVVSASSEDGDNIVAAFTSQKVTLTATVSGTESTELTYQWYKGTSTGPGTASLTAISGETQNALVINDGGETQTTTGTIYYNCLVNDTFEDVTNYAIVWDSRPSFSLKYYASSEASINACTGTSVTLYGDRAGVTSFCAAEKFYSNAAGSSSPAISAGTYSDSTTGTDGNFRYIEASGIPQGCVPYGCAGPPVVQPTTGTIQKIQARRCQGQGSPGIFEYFLLDGIDGYIAGQHILDIKDVGQTGGRGCYEIIETFEKTYTLPTPYFKIESTDLSQTIPYTNCDECLGIVEEEEGPVEPTLYFARFIKCGTDGGNITAVRSDQPI
jgi:hypothetical protein